MWYGETIQQAFEDELEYELEKALRQLEAELTLNEYETDLEDAIEWAFQPKVHQGGKGGKASRKPSPWLNLLNQVSQTIKKAMTYLGPPTKTRELNNSLNQARIQLGKAMREIAKVMSGNRISQVGDRLMNALLKLDAAKNAWDRGDISSVHTYLQGASLDLKQARDAVGLQEAELEQEQLLTNRNSSEYIRWIQSSLNQILGISVVVDGIMGPQTRNAIRRFQNLAGLQVDGIIGPKTEAALVSFKRKPVGFGQTTTTGITITPCPRLPGFFVVDSYGRNSHALQHHQSGMYGGILNTLWRILQSGCPRTLVRSIGHTSLEGDKGYNKGLGQRRADYLRDSLIKDLRAGLMRNGLSFQNADNTIRGTFVFSSHSRGETEPAALPDPISGEETEEDKRRNRRVEVELSLTP